MSQIVPKVIMAVLMLAAALLGTSNLFVSRARASSDGVLKDTVGAYIFLLSLSDTLDDVGSEYPDLEQRAKTAKKDFEAEFAIARKLMESDLASRGPKYITNATKAAVESSRKNDRVDRQDAEKLVDNVEGYAMGDNIETLPYRSTLLSWQYLDHPIDEMSDGYTSSLEVSAEALGGISLSLSYPLSWSEVSLDTGVRGIKSENGNGIAQISIQSIDSPNEPVTAEDFMKGNPAAKNIRLEQGLISDLPASIAIADAEMDGEESRIMAESSPRGPKTVLILLGVALPDEDAGQMDTEWARYQPLFKKITNSIKIRSQ